MSKVHRLVERRTTINSRKWENNKTFYIMEDIFKIVEKEEIIGKNISIIIIKINIEFVLIFIIILMKLFLFILVKEL